MYDSLVIRAVIFDLDGVIVSTDECHYQSWKHTADQHGLTFDRQTNQLLRGVSRLRSAEILLEKAGVSWPPRQVEDFAAEKNADYVTRIGSLSENDILPGVLELISRLKAMGIKLAIGSSSKNTGLILRRIGLDASFDAVADGTMITRSKPDPEVFLKAAELLDISPSECLVIEDAASGAEAARAGGMAVAVVGPLAAENLGDLNLPSFESAAIQEFLAFIGAQGIHSRMK